MDNPVDDTQMPKQNLEEELILKKPRIRQIIYSRLFISLIIVLSFCLLILILKESNSCAYKAYHRYLEKEICCPPLPECDEGGVLWSGMAGGCKTCVPAEMTPIID